jgi:mannose-6-phosphate isomerase-like protein (cupin superfamily)
MAKTKYGKYIITEPKPNFWSEEGAQKDGPDTIHPTVYIDNKVLKDAFYVECNWFWKANQYSPPVHSHEFDEVLAFIGTNPDDPQDLCGEVELWLDDEQYLLHKSCLVFIPQGLKHCPMLVKRLERPIFHFSVGTSGAYVKKRDK